MKLVLIIIFISFSCLNFGQDSLQIDTSTMTSPSTNVNIEVIDSVSSALKESTVKKKKQKKYSIKTKTKNEVITSKEVSQTNTNASGDDEGILSFGILIIVAIIVLALFRLISSHKNTTSTDEGFISDYLNRKLLSRQDYYRNVYLKSEAWKRKRYLVLRRDNWRCVYCGRQATQVHHTRYAKRNIGKEPIEWLVSICITCHESKH